MSQDLEKIYEKPHEVDQVTLAFPARLGVLLPDYDLLPDNYRSLDAWGCDRAEAWMFGMLKEYGEIGVAKPGIDFNLAIRHLTAILHSFEPKHEHKIAGAGYLIEKWFDDHEEEQ